MAYVRIIDGNTGKVIWGNEVKGVSTLITRYINAILPDAEHAVYVPSFKLVNATPEYEDYQTYNDGMKEVLRYCFDGDKLTQIMAVVAGYKVDGTPDVHQYKITINQFDNQVDSK